MESVSTESLENLVITTHDLDGCSGLVIRLSLFLQIPPRVALLSWISISFVSKLILPADIYFLHKNTIDPLKKKH